MSFQSGIYFDRDTRPGNSFAIVFLRADADSNSNEIAQNLSSLWDMLMKLENGFLENLHISDNNKFTGNLSVLIGYSPKIFTRTGIQKELPNNKYLGLFRNPNDDPHRRIANGSSLKYAEDLSSNIALDADIVIQFIAESEAATNRAVIETWKHLNQLSKNNSSSIGIIGFYTGFNSPDSRNLLQFHDGVSNIKSDQRIKSIFVEDSALDETQKWFTNGTFLSFLRISLNLQLWENLPVKLQERIIGRNKVTGCSIIGIDKNDENIYVRDCPVNGTSEIIEKGNEIFRELDPSIYGGIYQHYDRNDQASNSHVRKMSVPQKEAIGTAGYKIFRQGFNFIDHLDTYPYIRIGLNFVSFQNDLSVLFDMLKYGFHSGPDSGRYFGSFDEFISIISAGIFIVPPKNERESFPGESIFLSKNVFNYS